MNDVIAEVPGDHLSGSLARYRRYLTVVRQAMDGLIPVQDQNQDLNQDPKQGRGPNSTKPAVTLPSGSGAAAGV